MSDSLFTKWLSRQVLRHDAVGAFALAALADPAYPRESWRLHILLRRCAEPLRPGLKLAHAEWRVSR